MTVTADPTIHSTMHELLARWPSAREPLTRHGMACVGCPMARFETFAEAAVAYGLEPRALLREIAPHARRPRPSRRAVR